MEIKTNMAGNVWKITVELGDEITTGTQVVILESMKMEIPVETDITGEVSEILVNEGDFVNEGDTVIKLK